MKKWITGSVLACLVVLAAGFVAIRFERRQQWDSAFHSARDTYARAYDYRDAGFQVFDPRWLDYEKARDALNRIEPPDQDQMLRLASLSNCADLLETYRESLSINLEASRRGVSLEKVKQATEHTAQTGRMAGECLRDID